MPHVLLNVGTVVFAFGCLIELVFIVHYLLVAPAFKSLIGFMFVLRSLSFLFAGTAIIAGRVWGPNYAARPFVTLGLFIAVLISAIVTYVAFLRERYGRPHDRSRHQWHFPFAAQLRLSGPVAWIRARLRGKKDDDDQDSSGPHLQAVERRNA
jgi:hypothetical protein